MSRLSYFFKRLFKMDWKAMWKTAGLLHERSGKSRIWLLCDMLRCAVKYNAGYVDYKIAQMYKLNDAQRKTVITRGISNSIVRRMNDKAYWYLFDDKATFNRLFKDEVRQLGIELGLPENLVWRQPFPGPGLAIRIIGEITDEKLSILQDADWIFREEIAKAGLDRSIHQYFAVLTNMRSVGVMGDGRTYDYTLALRGVTTTDFMTADFARIPYEVLEVISARIVNEVKNINRVVYDITTKPPATIEWE